MVTDLIADTANASPPASVPRWLVDQQKQHIRAAGKHEPPPQIESSRKESTPSDSHRKRLSQIPEGKEQKGNSQPDDDDFIIVDLLDGAHLPTKNSPALKSISTDASFDSICALPPIDGDSQKWDKMNIKEAQKERRRRRGGNSFGAFALPSSLPFTGRPQSPPRRPRSPLWETKDACALPASSFPHRTERPHTAVNIGSLGSAEPVLDGTPLANNAYHSEQHAFYEADSAKEITPLLPRDSSISPSHWQQRPTHTKQGSFSIKRDIFMADEDGTSTNLSSSTANSHEKRQRRRTRARKWRARSEDRFQPSAWGWRRPAEEDAIVPSGAWLYLPLIGLLTFIMAYLINDLSAWIGHHIIHPCAEVIGAHAGGGRATMFALGGLRGISLAIAFFVVLYISPQYAAGSGIPEMKCVLSGVLMPRMLNWKTLVAKVVGLTFALASSISIGRLGPFIHISGITAALVAKIPWFTELHSSARFQLQALSAAMAAGVGATFGAPIGGTMLSIEVMSTYYYIHWLPMALYCSIAGYFFVVSFVEVKQHSYFTTMVNIELQLQSSQRLLTYVVLGALCGVVGACLVQFTKLAFQWRRAYFTNATPIRTAIMVLSFAAAHTVVTMSLGGIISVDQKLGVEALFNSRESSSAWMKTAWQPFNISHWNHAFYLLIQLLVKFFLTALSLVMPVPAGTFMPIFEVGALLGRLFGEVCSGFEFIDWVDSRATAIIGAAALTAGALHTTSIAVVMLELTREAIDVLPLAVGVIVSYGVSKQLCSDLFSELIKIRRLPFILGLRERYPSENKRFYETVSSIVAGSFMSTDFPYVTPTTTKGEVLNLLTRGGKPWINCAFLSDHKHRRLWGTVSQRSLWDALGDDVLSVTLNDSDDEMGTGGSYGSLGRDARWAHTQNDPIPFLRNFDPSVGSRHVDMGPMQVAYHTPFWKVIRYFRMLSMSTMYVMKDGETVGCVSKAQVISHSIDVEEKDKRRRSAAREMERQRQRDERDIIRKLRRDPQTSTRMASRVSEKDLLNFVAASGGRRNRQGSMSRSRR